MQVRIFVIESNTVRLEQAMGPGLQVEGFFFIILPKTDEKCIKCEISV
jgi:hypothetical protein